MGVRFSSPGGRLVRARNAPIQSRYTTKQFAGANKNAKTRGAVKPARLTMGPNANAARRARGL